MHTQYTHTMPSSNSHNHANTEQNKDSGKKRFPTEPKKESIEFGVSSFVLNLIYPPMLIVYDLL